MANPEHLDIFKSPMFNDWDKWRRQNPGVVADLSGEDLTEFIRPYKDIRDTNLAGVSLVGATLLGYNFSGATLCGAKLCGANFGTSNFGSANLANADLRDADFSRANLKDADLTGAILVWTTFRGGSLVGANFSNAVLLGTIFAETDLSQTRGLDEVRHHSPSTIGIETIYASKGKIPEVFLRGAGVPEDFIIHARSLGKGAPDFYSCFISYSTKDQALADRLRADLQINGVRCWFAPEDLKIGDPFRQRIDESIRVHDKLLLVLSENSVRSAWVQDEVETALEREHREEGVVLFPIRIDDAVMQTDTAWAASIRRTRHIGDFSNWKVHDTYHAAFQRLLRDLRAERLCKDTSR